MVGIMAWAAWSGAARADFVVRGAQPPAVSSSLTGASPDRPTGSDPGQATPAPGFKMAYGFGNQVPLSFACRQIVPRTVRVSYGPSARPDALVDWKGGDGWNHVLQKAVKPLGLRLVMSNMAVEIRR